MSEDVWKVEGDRVEPEPMRVGDSSWPLPRLRLTGDISAHDLSLVRLENPWLEVVVCPALGGRIVSLIDRTSGSPIWNLPAEIRLVEGGRRGVEWRQGAELNLSEGRLNSMGSVDWWIRDPDSIDGPAAVFLAEVCPGSPLAWHLCVSVPSDRAEILVECRIENRSLEVVRSGPSLVFHGTRMGGSGDGFVELVGPGGRLALVFDEGSFVRAESGGESTAVAILPGDVMTPRGIDSFKFRLASYSFLKHLTAVRQGLALYVDGPGLAIQATVSLGNCQVVARLANGQTLETLAELAPGKPFSANLPDEVTDVVIRDTNGNERLRWSATGLRPEDPGPSTLEDAILKASQPGSFGFEAEFLRRVSSGEPAPRAPLGLEAAAAWNQARIAARARDWREADLWIDEGLQRQTDDQLLWWLKALVARHRGETSGESTEILNAHFLAPLEPALRAEAFLSMDLSQGKEPSPLTKPLASFPDALLDVLNWLYDFGMVEDAARLADECLRHREIPLVRYLLAGSLLRQTRLEAEAAHQVRLASAAPLEPPFPWRRHEVDTIKLLAARFPSDPRLAELSALVAGPPS